MTKKHFIGLAQTFKMERPQENWDPNKLYMWNQLLKGVANVCQQTNSAFDRQRFFAAAGGLFDLDHRSVS